MAAFGCGLAALSARPCAAACRQAAPASNAHPVPRMGPSLRVLQPRRPAATAAGAAARRRRQRWAPAPPRAQGKEEEGVAAVGQDLDWGRVSADVKRRLVGVVGGHSGKADKLQAW